MKKLLLLLTILLTVGQPAISQDLTSGEKKKFEKEYYGNENYHNGFKLIKDGRTEEGRTAFLKASEEFEQESNWKGYVGANQQFIITYQFNSNHQLGIDKGKQVLERIEEVGEDAKKHAFHIWREIARLYSKQQQFELSLQSHFKEKEILETYWMGEEYEGAYPYYYGSMYNDIGFLYVQIEEPEKAKESFLKAIEIGANGPNCDWCKVLMANASTNLGGNYYRDKGMLIEAVEYIEQGIAWYEEAKGQKDLGLIGQYLNIIYLYTALSEWEKSSQYYKKIIYIIEESGTKEDRYLQFHLPNALFMYSMGSAIVGKYGEAIIYSDKLIECVGDNDYMKPYTVKALVAKAKVAYEKEQFEQAEEHLLKADSINSYLKKVSNGRAENNEHNINLNFSNLWIEQSNYEKAAYYRLKAVNTPGVEKIEKYRALNELSEVYLLYGDIDSAEVCNRQAFKYFAKRFRPKSFYDLPEVDRLKEEQAIYKTLRVKSIIANERAKKSTRNSEKDSLFTLALESIELTNKYHQKNLKKMNLLRGAFSKGVFGKHTTAIQYGLTTIYDQYQYNKNEALLDKAFYLIQQIKGQQLSLSLLNEDALSFGKLPKELILKERDLLAQIQDYERELRKAKRKKNVKLIDTLENILLFNTNVAYKELLVEMEKNYPDYYEAKFDFKVETIEGVSQLLKEEELLVEYVVNDEELQILLIDSNGEAEFISTPIIEELLNEEFGILDILENASVMRKTKRVQFIKESNRLYKQLIQPIENKLKGKKKLVILPSYWSYYLPFEILLPTDEVKPFKKLDFLIKDFDISYHYSANLFAKARRAEQKQNQGIYAFAPVYEGEETENDIYPNSSRLRATDEEGKFSPLPESEKEVKAIEALFKGKNKFTKLSLRDEATEEQLKKELEQAYRFIHIAGHSFADTENPNFSGIACFRSIKEDGVLYNGEINNLTMQADLITLSSCESGFGKLNYNEGLLGLNRAFMYAGTPNVVFSLWKVYDKVSAKLMVKFYEGILNGETYSQSLRNAKLELLKKESTANPHFWSPYLLIGR